MITKTNGVILKEAETKQEKQILGILHAETKSIDYGKIILELDVFAGKIKRAKVVEKGKSYKLD